MKRKRAAAIKLLLTVGLALFIASAPASARDQWQINRPDPPPTGPVGGARWTSGSPGQGMQSQGQIPGMQAPTGSQLPGFTGAPGGGPPDGYYMPPDNQIPGLVPPGALQGTPPPPSLIPQGKGVLPDFFKQIVGSRLPMGTVLTGVTETTLSSTKSKRGDVFAITLPHGYLNEGEQIIPPGSRILGIVTDSAPAKMQRLGQPGRLSISLKTIVFPDGRASSINGFIDHNPAHDQLNEPKTKMGGFGLGDYGNAFKGMLYSSVSGIAWVHNNQMKGKEFLLKEGTPVSVKLNTTLDVSKMTNPTAPLMATPPGGIPGAFPGQQIPGMPPGAVPGNVPGMSGVPGLPVGPGPNGIPGLAGAPPAVAPGFGGQQGTPFFPNNLQSPEQLPSGGFSQPPTAIEEDPNAIFKTPIASPKVSTPDPF